MDMATVGIKSIKRDIAPGFELNGGDLEKDIHNVLASLDGHSILGIVVKDILLDYTDMTPLNGIKVAAKNDQDVCHGRYGGINTYPMGALTNTLYGDFLGISIGNDLKAKNTFDHALKHCVDYQSCRKNNMTQENPAVVILTDRWCPELFKKYEDYYIKFAIECNIDFYIFLITSYGIKEVPFLGKGFISQLRSKYRGNTIKIS